MDPPSRPARRRAADAAHGEPEEALDGRAAVGDPQPAGDGDVPRADAGAPQPAGGTGGAPARPSRRRRWSRALGWAASAGLFAAALLPLRDRWQAVGEAGGLPGLAPAVAAVGLYVVANGVLADTWRRVVALTGTRLAYPVAAWVWALSQLARYTVGAAQVGGRAVAGRRYGLTATAGVVTTLVEVGWQASLTATLVLATLPWWLPGAEGLTWLAWVGTAPAALLLVGLAAPRRLLTAVAAVLEWAPLARLTGGRLSGVAERVPLSRAAAARITAHFASNSLLRVAAFLLLFAAVGGDVPGDGLLAVGAYAVGQLVGRLAVFSPGGIGPREGATALAVAPAVGGGPAVVLVAATRLLEIVAELAFFALARLGRRGAR